MKSTSTNEKRSLTLNLAPQEMLALEELASRKELSKTAVIRQALRLYNMLDERISQGERLVIEDDKLQKKSEVMML